MARKTAEIEDTNLDTGLEDDLFAAGFDEAIGGEPEVKEEAEPVAEPEVAEVKEDKPVDTPAVETPAPIDIKAVIAEAVAAAAPAKEVVKPEEPAAHTPTAEELAAEEQYKKDWPEHAAREERLKAELASVKELLTTTVEALKGQIAPIVAAIATSAEEKHVSTIIAAHKDAFDIVPDVQKWVATQPKFLQPQYTAVLENGTAAEVVKLFDLYKKKAGLVNKSEVDAEAEAAKAAEEAAKAEKLKKMRGVTTLRTSLTAEEDPDDFEGAFDAELKKLKVA